MSTATHLDSLEAEINDIEARLDNTDRFRAELDRREAGRSLGDWLRSLPAKARSWGRSVIEFLHLGAISETAREAAGKAWEMLGRLVTPLRKIGLFNILGALLTCQKGRDIVRSVTGKAARVVTYPFRIIGRVLGWLGRKVGLGTVVDYCERKAFDAEYFVTEKFAQGMDWMDEHEHSGGMRWGRSYYQAGVAYKTITAYAPANLRAPLYIGSLFIPNLGVGNGSVGSDADGTWHTTTESKFSVVSDTVKNGESPTVPVTDLKSDPPVPVAVVPEQPAEPAEPKAKDDIEMLSGVIIGSGKRVRLQKITKVDGTVLYRYNGREYTEATLPGNLQIENLTDKVAANGEAKPMNRAARRAAGERASK